MLILTRKYGESITIGDEIKVHVIEIRGKQVRLGVDAPAEKFKIHRAEVYARILEKRRADLDQAKSA